MIQIAVLGIGGTGGYFGGLLARHYRNSNEVSITFIARGENEKAIREKGISVRSADATIGNFTGFPAKVSSDPAVIGAIDILLCCTKSYDLEESLQRYRNNISSKTIILPLLNGVDNSDRIKALFPEARVWLGCAYIVSRLTAPGIITESGVVRKIHFGSMEESDEELKKVESLFTNAGIDAAWKKDIKETIWKKFIFISAVATLTSSMKLSIGELLQDEQCKNTLQQMIAEVYSLAIAKGIILNGEIKMETMATAHRLPFATTTSMQNDFATHHRTELESLTGYVVREAEKHKLRVPNFTAHYEKLKTHI